MDSSVVPRVIKFGFRNFVQTKDSRKATCTFCNKHMKGDAPGTSSNFVRPVKTSHSHKCAAIHYHFILKLTKSKTRPSQGLIRRLK